MRTHARQQRGGRPGRRAGAGLAGCAGAVLVLVACSVDDTSVSPDSGSVSGSGSADTTPGDTAEPAAPTAATDVLVVTVTGQGASRVMTLTCSPPGGDHPMPQQACAALEAYLAAQTPADTGSATDCPGSGDLKESGQRVTVVGMLDGEPVDIHVTRSECDGVWGALLAVIAPPNAG